MHSEWHQISAPIRNSEMANDVHEAIGQSNNTKRMVKAI